MKPKRKEKEGEKERRRKEKEKRRKNYDIFEVMTSFDSLVQLQFFEYFPENIRKKSKVSIKKSEIAV